MRARSAISMARSGRFSLAMRPRKARYPPAAIAKPVKVARQPMILRGLPIGPGHRLALRVRNRHEPQHRERAEDCVEIRKIEPPVHGRYCLVRALGQEGQVQVVGVTMNDVEISFPAPDPIE